MGGIDVVVPGVLIRGTVGVIARIEEGLSLAGVWRDDFVVPGEAAVVETLAEEDDVRQQVVHGQNDHGRQDALKDAANDIEEVAQAPDDDELYGEGLGATAAEILEDLGGEDAVRVSEGCVTKVERGLT